MSDSTQARVTVSADEIQAATLIGQVHSLDKGGIALFLGAVRSCNHGKDVRAVEYEAYASMAVAELTRIQTEVEAATGAKLALAHRLGRLEVGEVSLGVVAASVHRAEAFEGCRQAVEAIKQRAPIWKHEHYTDGTSAYLKGCSHQAIASPETASHGTPASRGVPASHEVIDKRP